MDTLLISRHIKVFYFFSLSLFLPLTSLYADSVRFTTHFQRFGRFEGFNPTCYHLRGRFKPHHEMRLPSVGTLRINKKEYRYISGVTEVLNSSAISKDGRPLGKGLFIRKDISYSEAPKKYDIIGNNNTIYE